VNFFDSIKTCFVKYTTFSGRAVRSEYWNFTLFLVIFSFIFDYIDSLVAGVSYWEYTDLFGPLSVIYIIATTIPGLSVSVRRLHDVNKSGWWLFLSFTVIGLIPLIYWACKKGDEEDNKFGPNSLK
jgi:uncharacterized membrane protein YhaH (DUF805 family)